MFLLATTTWISALLVNFNPLMRFDGYFILSDWLDIPNLHDRAFALARWHSRQTVLGVSEKPPEVLPAKTRRVLIVLAWVTWLYRLVLYLGIAFLVYHFFIKLVGILLFVVEMWWFILKPISRELSTWWERRAEWRGGRRVRINAIIAGAMLVLLFAPLPTRVRATAILSPEQLSRIYAPEAGRLAISPSTGADVSAGQTIAVIESVSVDRQRNLLEAKVDALQQQFATAAFDEELRPQLLVLQSDLAAAEASLDSVSRQASRLDLRAPFAGQVVDVDPELSKGDWLAKGTQVAILTGRSGWRAVAYVSEDEAKRLSKGDRALFFPGRQAGKPINLVVDTVDGDSTRALPDTRFASSAGGDVSTLTVGDRLVPENAVYRVTMRTTKVPQEIASQSWRGEVVIRGDWSSTGLRYLEAALAVIVRETGF